MATFLPVARWVPRQTVAKDPDLSCWGGIDSTGGGGGGRDGECEGTAMGRWRGELIQLTEGETIKTAGFGALFR